MKTDERERQAWAQGDAERARLLARIADLERLCNQLTDELIDLKAAHADHEGRTL